LLTIVQELEWTWLYVESIGDVASQWIRLVHLDKKRDEHTDIDV